MVTKIFKLTLYWLTKMLLIAQNTPKNRKYRKIKNTFWVNMRKIKFSLNIRKP